MEITEISRRLSDRADIVAALLLPGGKIEGKEWTVGSVNGEKGKSCKVHLSGDKAGVWKDFASGEGGDLIDLWRTVKGVSLRDALKEIKEYLGVQEQERKPSKTYTRPVLPPGAKDADKVLSYLKGRKLQDETISRYRVMENRGHILFPYFRDGELIFHKHLAIERDEKGKKKTWVSKDSEPCLFGWQAINPDARVITICEGEIDAMTLFQYGKPALSVPFGAGIGGKHEWIETEWKQLEQFETIFLCMDMDEEGRKAAKEISNRLGIHRCRIVSLPYKDPNECLKQGLPAIEIFECYHNAAYVDPAELKRVMDFEKQVIERFYPPSKKLPGFELPWEKTKGKIRILPAEVSVWAGYNGAGKSLFLGQIVSHAIGKGFRCCIASFEMPAEKTIGRIVYQELGDAPPIEYIQQELRRLNEGLWVFDLVGTGKAARMMEVFQYAFRRYGITQFVVDSLAKLGMAEDDYAGQKALVEQLGDFVRSNGAHIHLVAHARKGKDEFEPPRKMDIKGTGAITDMVDNVFIVHRNKKKYKMIAEAAEKGADTGALRKKYDTLLICDKARENGSEAEGTYGLYFNRSYQRFVEKQD